MKKYVRYLFLFSLPVIMSFTLGECEGPGVIFSLDCDFTSQESFRDFKYPYGVTSNGQIWHWDYNVCLSLLDYEVPNNHSLNRIANGYPVLVVGHAGTIVREEQFGWELKVSPTNEDLRDVCHSTGDIFYAAGNNGTVIKSTDNGNSWFQLPTFTTEDLYEIVCASNTIEVFGTNVTAFKSTDGGITWNQMNLYGEKNSNLQNGGPDVYTSFFLNADTGYVFGEFGTIFYTSDGGDQWTPGIVPNFERINTAYFISPDSGMVAGDHGKVRFTVNGGATWVEDTSVTNLTSQNINHISIIDNSVAVIVGDSGTIIFTAQDSSALTSVNNNSVIVTEYKLNQNYPNPFNPSTHIQYSIPQYGLVTIIVYDMLGDKVATLVDGYNPSGSYEVEFDASELTSGIYFYRINIGNEFKETKKMILLK